jgi:translation initiation factor IF-2
MAKKKIGDIAEAHDLNPKEVVKQLQEAGFSVQNQRSTIDENLALKVLKVGESKAAGNGGSAQAEADAKSAPRKVQPAGSQPRPQERRPPRDPQQGGRGPQGQGGRGGGRPQGQAPDRGGRPQGQAGGQQRQGGGGQRSGAGAGAGGGGGGPRGQRPTRDDQRTGERAPNAGGGPRRVVIDSQASRRQGPGGGPGGGPGFPPRRPPRRGGRRRRGTYDEEKEFRPLDTDAQKAIDTIRVNSGSTVKDVAEYLGVPVPEIIKKLMGMGEMATLTQTLSDDAIQVLAEEFDKTVDIVHAADDVDSEPDFDDADEELAPRPPVVTIMGHVDHGKTSLLDAIRETQVASGEAGGITQHIGAYQAEHDGYKITFLDTPGHEAFTAMRARGSKTADIAVIVVAADDGVKPQTEEAIDHAKAADVPMLVAVNKIDKEGADPVRTRTEMAQRGINPSEWGGDVEFVDVSAKTKVGLENLLETIQVVADLQEITANPEADASGVVIESKLDPGRGPVVTVLIQRGTLHVGDAVVAGSNWGRVRAMSDFKGERVKAALPGDPVEVLGFDGVPEAGDYVHVVENDRRARQLATERSQRLKTESLARRSGRKVSLEDVFKRAREGELKELALVIKGDVAGSVEALEDEIAKLPQTEVTVNVIHRGVGGINESDVMLAAASEAVVIGFNVRPVGDAAAVADREGVEIRGYSVIYRVIDELRAAMQGLLEPEEVEETVGSIEVRQIFRASKIGTIAGSYVTDGTIRRGAKVRLVRDGTIVYTGEIESLRRFNDDVREVAAGFECGIVLRNFQDVKEGDKMEVFQTRQVERELA